MPTQYKTTFQVRPSSLRRLLREARVHRLVIRQRSGRLFIRVSVLVAVIVTAVAPQAALAVALYALWKRMDVEIVRRGAQPTTA